MTDRRPGTAGDRLASLPSGEPVLPRWFAIALVVLVPVGVAVSVWAFTSFDREELSPAQRRPPGTTAMTHERGDAALNEITTTEPGPACATEITLLGDAGGRAAGRRVLGGVCTLLGRGGFERAEEGLRRWTEHDGVLRFAVFEVTGLDSTARAEHGRVVIELNAKFQFEDATLAAPAVIHELAHLAGSWPGSAVSAEDELEAVQAQARACEDLVLPDDPPRGCTDARALLEATDPLSLLLEAGYRHDR